MHSFSWKTCNIKENTMKNNGIAQKAGYYTVNLEVEGQRIPYIVFAVSDYQAAVKVRNQTGYMAASQQDVHGPHERF